MATLLAFASAPQKIHYNLPPSFFFLLWFGFLALIVLIAWAAMRERRKRREALEQLAMESGFLFIDKPDDATASELAQVQVSGPQSGLASRPRFSNVLRGSAAGTETIIADRTVGGGKSQSTSTIISFKFANPLPEFMLCRETLLWRVADKVGYSDIDLDAAPDFSRRYFLHGKDQAAVRALFRPEVTQAFEQLDAKSNLFVSGAGGWLTFYRPGRTIPVPELRDFLQQAEMLTNAFRRAQSSHVF